MSTSLWFTWRRSYRQRTLTSQAADAGFVPAINLAEEIHTKLSKMELNENSTHCALVTNCLSAVYSITSAMMKMTNPSRL